jgi:hypothetical protein
MFFRDVIGLYGENYRICGQNAEYLNVKIIWCISLPLCCKGLKYGEDKPPG